MTLSEFDIFQINENVFCKGSLCVLHIVARFWHIYSFEIELVMPISHNRVQFTLYTLHMPLYVYVEKSSRNK